MHNTGCDLPPRVVAQQDGVKIEHYYHGGEGPDHGPPHMHVLGGDEVKIGQNGWPLKNEPKLSARQRDVIEDNLRNIRKTARQIGKWYRNNLR